MAHDPKIEIEIDYVNWRGERSLRKIIPFDGGIRFGSSQWHPEPQWLIKAICLRDNSVKEFALSGIRSSSYPSMTGSNADLRG